MSAVLAALAAGAAGCHGTVGGGGAPGRGDGGPAPEHLDDPRPPRDAVRVTVEGVLDGDTLVAQVRGRRERVRLIGVDAPEMTPRAECHGARATVALRRLAGRGTTLRLYGDRDPRDRYGRTLGYVWTADGEFVNAALIRGGHARPMPIPPNDRYAVLLRGAEREARRVGKGLWSECRDRP